MHTKHTRLLLGAHMSIAGGFEKALERGESIGCTTIQIFTKSNRQWLAKPITTDDAQLFRSAHRTSNIDPIVAHASYLINCAAAQEDLYSKSITALVDELERCEMLDIPYLVLHPGASTNQSKEQALMRLSRALDRAFELAQSKTMILLETMAGQGSSLCSTFEEIAQAIKLSNHKKRLGICVDTCHLFAAGYDISSPGEYEHVWRTFNKTLGLEHLKVIHLNDSLKALNSNVDRHADIGKGLLGTKAFELLMNDERFLHIPKILETPQTSDHIEQDYRKNMDLLESLIGEKMRDILKE